MRSTNSIKNAIVATIMNLVIVLIGFIAQRIFLQTLGTEYLGINGLFTNILSMLGIIELGLGSAIIYHLYQPIAEDDKNKIKSLMLFYKVGYRVIGFIIAILGLLLIPFLHPGWFCSILSPFWMCFLFFLKGVLYGILILLHHFYHA